MIIGLGTTVLARNRSRGIADGITTYSGCLLDALRAQAAGGHQIVEAAFEAPRAGGGRLGGFRRGQALSLVSGYRHPPERLFGRPLDLFHALDHYIPALTVPVVATIHDATAFSRPEYVPGSMRRLKNLVFRRSCRQLDHVITVSNFAAAELVRHLGVDPRRLSVIYEGIAPHIQAEALRPLDWRALERDFALRPGYVLFCGAISIRKNLGRLLDAYLGLPPRLQQEHPLVVVGGEYAPGVGGDIPARLRALQQAGRARWLGRLDDAALARVLHHATMLAFPSLHEGFGLPVVEAFHLGVPVLTSNRSALPEIAGEAALLVDPEHGADIARGLFALLSDPAARQELAQQGRRRSGLFDWARCARETAEVYAVAGRR